MCKRPDIFFKKKLKKHNCICEFHSTFCVTILLNSLRAVEAFTCKVFLENRFIFFFLPNLHFSSQVLCSLCFLDGFVLGEFPLSMCTNQCYVTIWQMKSLPLETFGYLTNIQSGLSPQAVCLDPDLGCFQGFNFCRVRCKVLHNLPVTVIIPPGVLMQS